MRRMSLAVAAGTAVALTAAVWAADPQVANVRAQQLSGTAVEVFYDLSGAPAGEAPVTAADPGGGGGDELTIMLPGNVPLVLVRIPYGTFQMGSPDTERGRDSDEGPQHQVTISQDYYVGKTEVTQRQWQAVMGTAMPTSCGSLGTGDDYPVYCVSWNDICGGSTVSDCVASSFIGKVNQLLGTTKFRLPTEAEWERAARGGTTGPFSFDTSGSPNWDTECGSFPEAEGSMWWCGNNSPHGTKPVGQKEANPYGLHDVHGNVYEWVGDWLESYTAASVTDPAGPSSGSGRVLRGGSWPAYARAGRSSGRDWHYPDTRQSDIGFRLAASGVGSPITTPSAHAYVIPAAAHAGGALNTNWVSDAVLHNPGVDPAAGLLFLMKSGQDNSGALGRPFGVAAGASLRLADLVLASFAESAAKGAVLVAADRDLVVTSRTYNNLATGTYGQYIEGYPLAQAIGQNQEARLIQLTKSSSYRTNIGFANTTGTSLPVEVKLYRATGDLIGTRSYTISPYGYFQEDDIVGKVTSSSVDDAYAIVKSTTSGAKYFTYASIIDNRSGDPIAVMPPVMGTGVIYVPGGAALTGTGGTNWKTDLELHNPGATQANYTIALLKRDQANPSPTTKSYSLGPGQSVRYANVLSSMFSSSGAATLRITATSGQVIATARTYNDQPGGTYGQFIAGAFESQAIAYGQEGRLVQLAQSSSDSTGFRTNLGLVSATGSTISVEAKLYKGDGTLLGTRTYSLGAYESKQFDRVFREVTSGDVTDGFAVVRTTTSGGKFFAFASVVDNRSGDPVYMPARVSGSVSGGADELTVMLPGNVQLVLKRISAGTFEMGSPDSERGRDSDEGPQHQVTISQDYYLGKYEVTQRQWVAVMESNPSSSCGGYGIGDDYPVYCVSWNDICGGVTVSDCVASSFIGKVNQLLGTTKFRLPTEAEWERAARGGTTGPFSFDTSGSPSWDTGCGSFPQAAPYMWWCNNSGSTTHPVGQKQANLYGLYDMHGNVWEWVRDKYGSYSSTAVTDPTGPTSGSIRVVRGGSWNHYASFCRSARRYYYSSGYHYRGIGFRLARSQ